MQSAVAVNADTLAPHSLCTAPSGCRWHCACVAVFLWNLQETGRFVEAGISINSRNGLEVGSVSQERQGYGFETRRPLENLVMIFERKIRNLDFLIIA